MRAKTTKAAEMLSQPVVRQGASWARTLACTLIAAGAALMVATAAATPALAHNRADRAELEARLAGIENAIRDQEERLLRLEEDRLTGDPIAERLLDRLDALEAQLASMTGALERSSLENQQLRSRLATLVREVQLRDQELAAALNLPSTAYAPFDPESPFNRVQSQAFAGAAPAADLSGAGASPVDAAVGAPSTAFDTGAPAAPADFASMSQPASSFEGSTGPDTPLTAAASAASSAGSGGVQVEVPSDDAAALKLGKDYIIAGQYDEAHGVFAVFVERFSNSEYIGEAWYWKGEVDSVRRLYDGAARAYIQSLDVDPDGPKAPEAMISLSIALNNLGLAEDACQQLDDFRRTYPRAAPTINARAQQARAIVGCQ